MNTVVSVAIQVYVQAVTGRQVLGTCSQPVHAGRDRTSGTDLTPDHRDKEVSVPALPQTTGIKRRATFVIT